jgi:hypothetical protein
MGHMRGDTSRVVQRKPLPLTERDLEDLRRLHDAESPQRRALRQLLGSEPGRSDAQVLHALLVVGLRCVEEQVEEEGYRQLAPARTWDEEAELGALRERRRFRRAEDD